MTNDTNYLISQASAQLKEISSHDSDNNETTKSESKSNIAGPLSTDRYQNELEHLQSSQSTYLTDPELSSKACLFFFADKFI